MIAISIVLSGFLVAIVICEAVLRRQKVQFAAVSLVLIHSIVCLGTTFLVLHSVDVSAVSILIFWSGALLAWLGVRTHLESSILLRMLSIMNSSGGIMTTSILSHAYNKNHGVEVRLRELEEAGYITRESDHVVILEKGRRARKIHGLVTYFWHR